MKIIPTPAYANVTSGAVQSDHPSNFIDVSLETPDQQFEALTAMLAENDLAAPSPNTTTPPWGEPTPPDEYLSDDVQMEAYLPPVDLEPSANVELESVINDAYPADIPEWTWENDDQYYGLGVPPGVPNYGQPIESGHTQIILPNPSAELGWDAWSGKFDIARVARMENHFDGYSAGTNRGHMVRTIYQNVPRYLYTQQMRDLMLAEIQRRGIHNVVVADVPAQTYTEQVATVDPAYYPPEPVFGEEGIL